MNEILIPFLVCHYTPEKVRREYIEREWQKHPDRSRFNLQFIAEHDKEQPHVASSYRYDEKLYREMIAPIKNLQVGYWLGLNFFPTASFSSCVEWHKSKNTTLDQDFQTYPWLKPGPLSPGEVSLVWKHREAWTRIAESDAEYAIVAEDDIIFSQTSLAYLVDLLKNLPPNVEYADIGGGVGWFVPRIGNTCRRKYFYEIVPPKTRATCAAILKQSFVRSLVDLSLPICLSSDWMLNHAFTKLNTKVYWVEPTVFGHGSMMKRYDSLITK
jgi:hypothetical protein